MPGGKNHRSPGPFFIYDMFLNNKVQSEFFYMKPNSSDLRISDWWAHKLSYPWLLPSLNRKLSHMDNRHWDLTPRDTNPIEGSHAQDNQVNDTRRSLLEAILL